MSRDPPEAHAFGDKVPGYIAAKVLGFVDGILNNVLQVLGHLAGQQLYPAGAEEPDGVTLEACRAKRHGVHPVPRAAVEVDVGKPVGQGEDVVGVVTAPSGAGNVVAGHAGVGVRPGDAIEVVGEVLAGARVDQRVVVASEDVGRLGSARPGPAC